MRSLRKIAYAALLALTTMTFLPSLVAAEDARGSFTLTRDVHWQNAFIPAGDYSFLYESMGPGGLLTLQKVSGNAAGYMMYVRDVGFAKASEASQLLLESTPEGSFVSAMNLPQSGLILRFTVPGH